MKFKEMVLVGAALIAVYTAGKAAGHIACFNKLMAKYGEELLDNHDEIISKIGRNFTIKVIKTSK